MCYLKFYAILLDKQSIVTKYFGFLLALSNWDGVFYHQTVKNIIDKTIQQ